MDLVSAATTKEFRCGGGHGQSATRNNQHQTKAIFDSHAAIIHAFSTSFLSWPAGSAAAPDDDTQRAAPARRSGAQAPSGEEGLAVEEGLQDAMAALSSQRQP